MNLKSNLTHHGLKNLGHFVIYKKESRNLKQNKRKNKINRLDKVLEMPEEISSNEPKITILGFNQMLIENYKGILEYQEFFIRLNTYIGIVNINGFNLNLSEMTTDDILITGKIESVDFESIEDDE